MHRSRAGDVSALASSAPKILAAPCMRTDPWGCVLACPARSVPARCARVRGTHACLKPPTPRIGRVRAHVVERRAHHRRGAAARRRPSSPPEHRRRPRARSPSAAARKRRSTVPRIDEITAQERRQCQTCSAAAQIAREVAGSQMRVAARHTSQLTPHAAGRA